MSKLTSALLITSYAATCLAPAQAQIRETTGEAGAVSAETSGALPGEPVRSLLIGNEVFVSERIRTDASGSTQLLFLDGTRAFVYPSSEVILNSYRFDRRSAVVELVASVIEGDFRVTSPATNYAQAGAFASAGAAPTGAFATPLQPSSPLPSGEFVPSTAGAGGAGVATTAGSTGPGTTSPAPRASTPVPQPTPTPVFPPPQPPQGGGVTKIILIHIVGQPGSELIDVRSGSGGLQDLKISIAKGGLVNVLSLGSGAVSITTRNGAAQLSRPGFVVQVNRAGVMTGAMRATPEMFDRIAANPAKPATRLPPATRSGVAEAIREQNSARPIGQLRPRPVGASLREVDPRRLDHLAGNTPGQLGMIRQQNYVSNTIDASLTGAFLNVLPATVTVSAPGGTRTVSFSRAADGTLLASPAGTSLAGLNALGRPAMVTIVTAAGTRIATIPR